MAGKELLFDLDKIDMNTPTADIQAIRKINRQRYEMEQVTAIVYEDLQRNICVGYKDVTDQEFWIRGHMPGMPLMPGVIMLEAAAQMCSYFVQKNCLLETEVLGFGGLEEIRFRGPVVPGDRLIIICKLTKFRPRRMIVCRFKGIVGETVVVSGCIKGIPLPVDVLGESSSNADLPS